MSKDFSSGCYQMMGCAGYTLGKGGQLMKNSGKEKGMIHLTERRDWWTRRVHTVEYRGKTDSFVILYLQCIQYEYTHTVSQILPEAKKHFEDAESSWR